MKHVMKLTKETSPSRAYVWDWFINTKNGLENLGFGVINASKPAYANALWQSDDSLDPTDIDDVGLY